MTRNIEGRLAKLEAATPPSKAVDMFLQVQRHEGEPKEELEKRIQGLIRERAQRAGGEPGFVFVLITANKPKGDAHSLEGRSAGKSGGSVQ